MRMRRALKLNSVTAVLLVVLLLPIGGWGSRSTTKVADPGPPVLLLEGGRKLTFERSFGSEREVKPKRGFWNRLVDFIAGEPEFHSLIRPYSIAVDSQRRI